MLRETLADKQWAKWEDNILRDELSDQGHGRVVDCLRHVVQQRVDIVEFADKVL